MKNSQQISRRTWWRKLLGIAFWLLVIYAIVGFLVLPPLIRDQAEKQLTDLLGRRVTIKQFRLNPFTLSATVSGLRIQDQNDLTFVAWDEVYVNLQIYSLMSKALILREVNVVNPYIRVQVNKDKSLNFSDLLEKFSKTGPPEPSAKPSAPLAIRIQRLRISGAAAGYTDFTPRRPFTRRIGPLDLNLDNFRTDPDNENRYAFAGTTDAGEQFSWSGYFFLNPIRSRGELKLENLNLNKYSPLYQDFSRFEIRDGVIGLSSEYDIELSESNRAMSVSNLTFQLQSLKVGAQGGQGGVSNLLELSRFVVQGASVDAIRRTAEVRSIAGYGGRLTVKRDQNAAINVVDLAQPPAGAGGAPEGILMLLRSVTNAVTILLASTNQWAAKIDTINFWDNSLSLEDLVNSRPARLHLDHMEMSATNLSNMPGDNLTASFGLRWNTNGSMHADVSASFLPPTVDLHLALNQIDLHPLDPYLESKVNVIILRSKLGMDATVKLRTVSNQLPDVTMTGDVRLDDFSTVDGVLGEDLLGWKSFRLSGINANLSPPAVAIREVAIDDLSTRVVVETNHTVNLLAALNMNTAVTSADDDKLGRASSPLPAVTQTDDGDHGVTHSITNTPAIALPKISIATITLSNAHALLIDRSIKPNARLGVDEVNGIISNLTSEDAQHADVNLRAKVFGGAPFEIGGTVNPLGRGLDTDLHIGLSALDLTPASTYSGKFAGYRIAKGKLGLNLNYHIANRQLLASNIIELDQFTFGEKVQSTNATKLPVKLAIAILKDRDGKIFLDVPIEGSVDNPEFKLGKVISRAILNIIVKIATSPFSVLGALFGGGGEEMGSQTFAPGSSVLVTNETVKLDKLVKGLYARPTLEVAIAGSVDPEADLDGLRRLKLADQLRQMKWQSLRKAARATTKPEDISVSADERAELIKQLYRQILDAQTNAAPASNSIAAAAAKAGRSATNTAARYRTVEMKKGSEALMRAQDTTLVAAARAIAPANSAAGSAPQLSPEAMIEQAVLRTFPVTDEEFAALAAARAQAVKDYLQQVGKVEPQRLFLSEGGVDNVKQEGSRAILQLQ